MKVFIIIIINEMMGSSSHTDGLEIRYKFCIRSKKGDR